jgi:hypothetical protein
MNNKAVDPTYSMLLKRPWLWDAKMIDDWGTNMVTIEGNDIMNIIFVSKYLNGNIRKPRTIINYNFLEGVTNEEEEILLAFEPNLFSIGIIMLANQMVEGPHVQFKHEL